MKRAGRTVIHPDMKPARRHLCEICGDVFECHVCTIHLDHKMHSTIRILKLGESDPTLAIFVCEDCCVSDNSVYVRDAMADYKQGKAVGGKYWNYLTGEKVTALEIGRASMISANARTRKAWKLLEPRE